jgi:hypothetical protein
MSVVRVVLVVREDGSPKSLMERLSRMDLDNGGDLELTVAGEKGDERFSVEIETVSMEEE